MKVTTRLVGIGVIALMFASNTACTAAKATYQLVIAEQSVTRAQDYGAPELAVYEYTMALRYLEKSREEAGYAQYRVCVELAEKSAEWADKAIISIETRGSKNRLDLDLDEIQDLPDSGTPAGTETLPDLNDIPDLE
jgi:hypothetical protein